MAVLSLVVGAELPGLERSPPRLVLTIPLNGCPQGVAEPVTGRPAELVDLLRVDRVAPVVPGPVLHGLDQGLGLAGELEDLAREDDVRDLVAAAEVVDRGVGAPAQTKADLHAVTAPG